MSLRLTAGVFAGTVLLCGGMLLLSMDMSQGVLPLWPFWVLAGLGAVGLLYLLVRAPSHYAVLASALLCGLPMAGDWTTIGSWVGACLMGLAALPWWVQVLRGRLDWRTGYGWPILILVLWLCWGMVAAAGSPEPWYSARPALQLTLIALGGLACGHRIGSAPAMLRLWIFLSALGMGILAIRNLILWNALAKAAPAPYWLDANFFSAGLALLLPLLLGFLLIRDMTLMRLRRWQQIALGLLLLLLLVSIFRLGSRGAWLSLAAAAALIPLWYFHSRRIRWMWLLGLVGLVGIVFILLPRPQEKPRYQTSLDRLQSITNTEDFSNRERLMRWTCTWRMALEKPVLGHGPGRFAPLFKNFLADRHEGAQIAYWFGWRFGAHSDGLTVLAEAGFPGFLLFLAMLIAWGRVIVLKVADTPIHRGVRLALYAALITWVIHGLFNDLLSHACIAAWVFLLLGMFTAPKAVSSD